MASLTAVPPLPEIAADAVQALWFDSFWDFPRSGVARLNGRDVYYLLDAEDHVTFDEADADLEAEHDVYLNEQLVRSIGTKWDKRGPSPDLAALTDADVAERIADVERRWRARDPWARPERNRFALREMTAEASATLRARAERSLRRGCAHQFFRHCGPIWPGDLPEDVVPPASGWALAEGVSREAFAYCIMNFGPRLSQFTQTAWISRADGGPVPDGPAAAAVAVAVAVA